MIARVVPELCRANQLISTEETICWIKLSKYSAAAMGNALFS